LQVQVDALIEQRDGFEAEVERLRETIKAVIDCPAVFCDQCLEKLRTALNEENDSAE
jgi:hypothetical protein